MVNANQGMLISWGDFTRDAIKESESVFSYTCMLSRVKFIF